MKTMKLVFGMIIFSMATVIFAAGNTAVEPVSKIEDRWRSAGWTRGGGWIDQHEDINRIGQTQKVDVVFLGDSITQSFGGKGRNTRQPGRGVWEEYFAKYNPANFGISGDRTQHLLWRIDNGNFDNISPRVVVLMIGTNNMDDNTAEEIAEGVAVVVEKLKAKSPQSKVLLLSTFPRGEKPNHKYRIKTNKLNSIISKLHDGEVVHYLDISTVFLNADGSANAKLMAGDFIHLKPAGYGAWAKAVEHKLSQLFEEDYILKVINVRPHQRQIDYQRLGFTMFVHFGVNTFSDREWGSGKEDPVTFAPTEVDTDQWARAAKSAGMKMVVLTAKHHDGFCLWPSKYTEHSIKNSPYKDGKGDVLGELAKSCKKYGLKLGVYLSPADLYQIESKNGYYGNKSTPKMVTIPTVPPKGKTDHPTFTHKLDDYNTYFMNQLYELLTEYGPVHEVWFDGANPKPGTGQTYNYTEWYALIRTLAPEAVIFGKGPDVRWVGNEAGRSRQSEWSVVSVPNPPEAHDWGGMTRQDLGSRSVIKDAKYLIWYPAETDTSIRPGWFYHASQDGRVKSLEHLLDIYYGSTGGNSVLLLNVPPDRRGLLHENDVERLKELGDVLRETFRENLASGAKAKASAILNNDKTFSAANTVDGSEETYWTPGENMSVAHIEYDLGEPKTFNRAMVQEYIKLSQRVESFTIEALVDGEWKQVASATTIGYKRLLRFPDMTAQRVRMTITQCRVAPMISNFGLYRAPIQLTTPIIQRDRSGNVTIVCKPSGPQIRYTVDGSEPATDSPLYGGAIAMPKGGTVKAIAVVGGRVSKSIKAIFDVAPAKWKIHYVDSENPSSNEGAANAIDANPNTIWHSKWSGGADPRPHEIQIDLGETLAIKGFTYLPRNNSITGTIHDYEFYVSTDGKAWGEPVSKGRFDNIRNNPVEQRVRFDTPIKGRYIRLVGLTDLEDKPFISAAEIGVITR